MDARAVAASHPRSAVASSPPSFTAALGAAGHHDSRTPPSGVSYLAPPVSPGFTSSPSAYYTQVGMSPSVHHPSRSDSYPLHLFNQHKTVSRLPALHPQYASPMHALPVELLSRIFLIGWQEDPEPDLIPTSQVTFEVLVSHVCRHWRDVALHNPVLWSIIHFRTIPHMQRAQVYLSRSRHLIDIHVDTCAQEEHIPGFTLFRDEFFPVFGVVVSQIERWRSLHLKVRDLECKAGARKVLSSCGPAPHLETLHLWHIENWGTAERLYTAIGPPPVVVFDQSLPALKNIILTGVNLPWTHSAFLRNLTTVQFALHSDEVRMPYDLWRTMLVESPHLERLSLHYSGPRQGAGDWPDEKIVLPGLKEVELTNMEPSYLEKLFRRLEMPNVKNLRLQLEFQDQDLSEFIDYLVDPHAQDEPQEEESNANGAVIANPIENGNATPPTEEPSSSSSPRRRGPYFPALETLSVCALECSSDSFRKFLKAYRAVTHFEAEFGRMTDGLFQELFYIESSELVGEGKGKGKQTQSSTTSGIIPLPTLHTIRLSGLSPAQIRKYIDFRHDHFQPPLPSPTNADSPTDVRMFSPLSASDRNPPLLLRTHEDLHSYSHLSPPPPPIASPVKWLLEQSQCDEELDTWFADVGLYISEEEKEKRGWERRERVEWFTGEEDDEDDDDDNDDEQEGEDVADEGEDEGEDDD